MKTDRWATAYLLVLVVVVILWTCWLSPVYGGMP
jgi:hypothetical protein